MTADTQRTYTAKCPGCGAPIEFQSAQSSHAVCAYCHSTVARDAETLRRIGRMSEEFHDFSPLKLGASGQWNGLSFTVVGRIQLGAKGNRWTEWSLAGADGQVRVLSEDNGGFVISEESSWPREPEEPQSWRLGAVYTFDDQAFTVTTVRRVALLAAEGELGELPDSRAPFLAVELRSADGRVCSIDYGVRQPKPWIGVSVELTDLQLQGLDPRDEAASTARHFNCPQCGARVAVHFDGTKSLTCPSCGSLIDMSNGMGKELSAAKQTKTVEPVIPLGVTGELEGAAWQVVGFLVRVGSMGSDTFKWSEYLLFNQERGFAFLVDSEDGWSFVRPATGAANMSGSGQSATYLGRHYRLKERYLSRTTYVEGEFYWQVKIGDKVGHRDFSANRMLLSMEATNEEVVWSSGHVLSSKTVQKAFPMTASRVHASSNGFTYDAVPAASDGDWLAGIFRLVVILLIFLGIAFWLSRCGDGSSSYGNSYGSSYGGGYSGGWHK